MGKFRSFLTLAALGLPLLATSAYGYGGGAAAAAVILPSAAGSKHDDSMRAQAALFPELPATCLWMVSAGAMP